MTLLLFCNTIKWRSGSQSQKRTPTTRFVLVSSSSLPLSRCPFYYYIFLSRGRGEESWKNFSSPLPTLGAFRRSRGFCLGTKRGLGGFVSALFVEVELSKSGCFPSLWWKQSVVFGKLLALCTSSVSVVEDFFSQGFFFSRSSWPEWIALQCVHALSLQALQVAHIE